jgi:hypothetical protein
LKSSKRKALKFRCLSEYCFSRQFLAHYNLPKPQSICDGPGKRLANSSAIVLAVFNPIINKISVSAANFFKQTRLAFHLRLTAAADLLAG